MDPEPTEIRRQAAYVHGQWRVTYLRCVESGQQTDIERGLIVGPLIFDPSTAIMRVAVLPDGRTHHVLIRRDSITSIAPPDHEPGLN